jgi:hypothetical protein
MRGANDVEILDAMLTQGLLGAGFKTGKKFADLTVQEKQLAWQRFKTVAGEVNKAVDAQYEIAKFKLLSKAEPLKAEEGGAIYRTVNADNQMKFLQSHRTKNGVAFLELTNEQYAKAKGTVKEVEISNRQFEAANGIRLTADGKVTTIEPWRLAKNLDSVQGRNLREPRFVTPTTAEFVRQAEVVKGLQKVKEFRQEFGIGNRRNVGVADIEANGEKWTRVAHSQDQSKKGTSPVPTKRFFKTDVDGYNRAFDSEIKILEEFASKYANQRNVKGTIYLFTERPPCGSCTDVFPQFRKMFPNVKLEVASGNFIEKQGGK